jgi:hypothetical protein
MRPDPKRLTSTQAEATCQYCGWTKRVTADTAIQASLEASREHIEHRRAQHQIRLEKRAS